jgi:hypothetical protein
MEEETGLRSQDTADFLAVRGILVYRSTVCRWIRKSGFELAIHRDKRRRRIRLDWHVDALSVRISEVNIGLNLCHQNRTVSWLISTTHLCSKASTIRSNSGNMTRSIIAKRMISGLVRRYFKGSSFASPPALTQARRFWQDHAQARPSTASS